MSSVLGVNYRSGAVTVSAMDGLTGNLVGGGLDREVSQGNGDNITTRWDHARAKHWEGRVLCWHSTRWYEFYLGAIHATAGTFSGGFTFLKDGAWTANDGSSGTFIEDYVAGDGFVKVNVTSGALTNGAILTVTVGSETCVITSVPAARGAVDHEGEWGVIYTINYTIAGSNLNHTGIFAENVNNKSQIFGIYLSTNGGAGAGNWTSILYDGAAFTEAESGVGGGVVGEFPEVGRVTSLSAVHKGLIFHTRGSIINITHRRRFYTIKWNAETGAFERLLTSLGVSSIGGSWDAAVGWNIVEFNGLIWTAGAFYGDDTWRYTNLLRLVGTAFVEWTRFNGLNSPRTYPNLLFVGPTNGQTSSVKMGNTIFVLKDSLYMLTPGQGSGDPGRQIGWILVQFPSIAGVLQFFSHVTNITNNFALLANRQFGLDMLPANRALGTASLPEDDMPRWKVLLDNQTNDPDGEHRVLMYDQGGPGGAASNLYEFRGFETLNDVVYTWDTTTTVLISGVSTIIAGDWVSKPGDNESMFRVASVIAGVSFLLTNHTGKAIPAGAGDILRQRPFVNLGVDSVSTLLAIADDSRGAGDAQYRGGQNDITIQSGVKADGGFKYTFRVYSDSGVDVLNAQFFYGSKNTPWIPDSECTLINIVGGSATLNGNTIENLTADGVTDYEVTWAFLTDGAAALDLRTIHPKVFV